MKKYPQLRAFYAWRQAFNKHIELYHAKHATVQKLVLMKRIQDHTALKEFLYRWKYTFNLRFKNWHKIDARKKMLVRRDS